MALEQEADEQMRRDAVDEFACGNVAVVDEGTATAPALLTCRTAEGVGAELFWRVSVGAAAPGAAA